MAHFEVVGEDESGEPIYQLAGEDDDDVEGDVMGDVMGASQRRAIRRAGKSRGGKLLRLPPKPEWRRHQLAPGVIAPDEGMVPMPLTGGAGTPPGTFSATVPTITFSGQLQKPYRSERLLVSVVRTGVSAVGRLLGQLFVGTDLQQAEIQGWDLELVGQANAFGTRLTAKPAQPGVFIRLIVTLSTVLAGTDTIQANLMFLGRIVH